MLNVVFEPTKSVNRPPTGALFIRRTASCASIFTMSGGEQRPTVTDNCTRFIPPGRIAGSSASEMFSDAKG